MLRLEERVDVAGSSVPLIRLGLDVETGSDWPVSTLAAPATLWRSIVDELTAAWPGADRQSLFAENAIRVYRLPSV